MTIASGSMRAALIHLLPSNPYQAAPHAQAAAAATINRQVIGAGVNHSASTASSRMRQDLTSPVRTRQAKRHTVARLISESSRARLTGTE